MPGEDDGADISVAEQTVERERAMQFSRALRTLLQRQNYFVPLTGTYLLPQLYERIKAVDGRGIHVNTLRAYLRGESLPSDSKVRLIADALGLHRGMLLYAAGYLTTEDLPHYPGPYATLEAIQEDMREIESLPLSPATKQRVLHDLQASARILRLIAAERVMNGWSTQPDERELMIEQLIDIWESPAPMPPAYTSTERAAAQAQRERQVPSQPEVVRSAGVTAPEDEDKSKASPESVRA